MKVIIRKRDKNTYAQILFSYKNLCRIIWMIWSHLNLNLTFNYTTESTSVQTNTNFSLFWRTCWIGVFFPSFKYKKHRLIRRSLPWNALHVYKMSRASGRFEVAENRGKYGQGNGQREIRGVSQRRRERASGVLRIPRSSECRIESGVLYFPLNYTSSEIHFEQFEILTSSLALALRLWQNK